MRESIFIEQNKSKWTDFEGDLKNKKKDPAKLSKLFIEITDDLAYSRTFYKNRTVRVYLNGIARLLFNDLYRTEKGRFKKLVHFWKTELPLSYYNARKELTLSLIIFIISLAIGVISTRNDPQFAKQILGSQYVAMTEHNIAEGDPMAVYKQMRGGDMFLAITINNLKVDFIAFVMGIIGGIGSLFYLVYHGIMIGTFQYFFIERGLFQESFLTIFQHGTLEVATIIISSGAGIVLGKGLLFPGTYTRFQAFRMSAKKGLKLVLGILPVTIIAGFIEGFLTRYTETPDFIRVIVIIISLVFILGYFIWLPYKVARNPATKPIQKDIIEPKDPQPMVFNEIKDGGELFSMSFTFFQKNTALIARVILLTSLAFGILLTFDNHIFLQDESFEFINMFKTFLIFDYPKYPGSFVLVSLIFFGLQTFVYHGVSKENPYQQTPGFFRFMLTNTHRVLPFSLMANLFFFMKPGAGIPLLFIFLPFSFLFGYTAVNEKSMLFKAIGQSFSIMQKSFWKFFGLYMRSLLISGFLFLGITIVFYQLLIHTVITSIVDLPDQSMLLFYEFSSAFLFMVLLGLIIVLFATCSAFLYHGMVETTRANDLIDRINKIGSRTKIFGYEKEH